MRITLRQITSLVVIGLQVVAAGANASIPRSAVRTIDFSLVTNYSVFDSRNQLPLVPRVLAKDAITADDLTLRVPPALQAQSNAQAVGTWEQTQATSQANSSLGRQVLNTNLSRMLDEQKQKGGALGSVASVQDKVQTNVSFGGDEPGAIHHSVKVKVNAAQAQAIMNYSGFMNAEVSYNVGPNATMRAAITQKLDDAGITNLVIDHTDNRIEHAQHVSVSWNF